MAGGNRLRLVAAGLLSVAVITTDAGAQNDGNPLPEAPAAVVKNVRPPDGRRNERPIPLPTGKVTTPRAGERNSYGLRVTPELAEAYAAFLANDGERTLAALARASAPSRPDIRWVHNSLRAHAMIMMGRAADAEEELQNAARLEIAAFGKSLNTRALRAEARLWLGDLDGAIADASLVAEETKRWRLPTSYSNRPSDNEILHMVWQTTAQLRAYAILAGAHLLRGQADVALPWAEEAEQRFNDVHFVAAMPDAQGVLPVHGDSWVGRAQNLVFVGTARTIVRRDPAAGDSAFNAARRFFEAIGFAAGSATTDAFRAWSLFAIGRMAEGEPIAAQAVQQANAIGLIDLVWRVEAARGEALLALNRAADAEQAFRRAQVAVDTVSGGLATDRSKRRFGVSKEDITYRLAAIAAARNDPDQLFESLERGRARAFVDLLADRSAGVAQERATLLQVRDLDRRIRQERIAATGLGASPQAAQRETDLRRQRETLMQALRARAPELADTLDIATHTLADVRRSLKPGDVLAYAFPGRASDEVRVLLADSQQARLQTLTLRTADLRALLKAFAEGMTNLDTAAMTASVQALDAALGVKQWGATNTLYVVPSGDFHFVPWGALSIEIPVVVLPTGGWLQREDASAAGGRPTIVGDPDFRGRLPALPGARAEAGEVAGRYQVEPLIGGAATEERLRQTVGQGTTILHLATHGAFDAERPLDSAIYLSGPTEVRALTAANLFDRPIAANLVVLSACETGLGTAEAGEDFLGLARSFYLGGTRALLNSLWPVEDEGTRLFMTVFHEAAEKGDLGQAWLTARNAARTRGLPPAVYGGFVLGGSRTLAIAR